MTDNTMRAAVVEWQTRYMGDPRQPGFWKQVWDNTWAAKQYAAISSESNKDGWQVRPLYTAAAMDAARAEGYKAGIERAAEICGRMVSVSAVSYETGAACAEAIRAEIGKEG